MKNFLFLTFLIVLFLTQNASACSIAYIPNHPVTKIFSVIINTSATDVYRTFDAKKYIKIRQTGGGADCGPFRTYIRKDVVFGGAIILLVVGYFIFKKKKTPRN